MIHKCEVNGFRFTVGPEGSGCDLSIDDCDALIRTFRLWNHRHPGKEVPKGAPGCRQLVEAIIRVKTILGGNITY